MEALIQVAIAHKKFSKIASRTKLNDFNTISGSHVNKYKTTPEVVVCPKHIEW
jgi:hypothetical protein